MANSFVGKVVDKVKSIVSPKRYPTPTPTKQYSAPIGPERQSTKPSEDKAAKVLKLPPTPSVKQLINNPPTKSSRSGGGGSKGSSTSPVSTEQYSAPIGPQPMSTPSNYLQRQNALNEAKAKQADTNYILNTNKSLAQTTKDILRRQEDEIAPYRKTKSEILSHPIQSFFSGLKIGAIEAKQAYTNFGTTSSSFFGYGVYSTPTFENKTGLYNSGATFKGFGIPIFSTKQIFKQRDIAEQGVAIQQAFSSNLNKTQTEFNTKYGSLINTSSNEFIGTPEQYQQYQIDFNKLNTTYNQQTNKLTSLGLGSTNSTGSFNFNVPTSINAQIYASGTTKEKAISTTNILLGRTAEAFAGGAVLKSAGVISTIGRGAEFLSGTGKVGKAAVIATGTAFTVGPVALSSVSGYKEFSAAGASGKAGAIQGAAVGVGELSGFITGATGGEILFGPGLKYRTFGGSEEFGISKTRVLSLENPFGKGAVPLVTKSPDGFSLGYPKEITGKTFGLTPELEAGSYGFQAASKTEVAFLNKAISRGTGRLATEQIIFEQGLDITKGLSGVKIKEINAIPFEKSGVFKNLEGNTKAQEFIKTSFTEFGKEQRGLTGFKNALYNEGLERIYGSSTISTEGGFKTNVVRVNSEFGDFDLNFRGSAIPRATKFYQGLKATGADVKLTGSLIELKNPKTGKYEHAFDFHGADTPDLQMSSLKLGIKGVGTKEFGLATGTIRGQQLRQSLVDKGSATLQLRVNKQNQFYFSPPDYRLKDVTDFVSISERLNQIKGGNLFGGKIESFKNTLQVAYPDIKFGGESKLLFGSLGESKSAGVINVPSINNRYRRSRGSYSPYQSPIQSLSLSPSTSPSFSPSISPASKFSLSPSTSPSFSPSPYPSPSTSPSFSPSPYPSISPPSSPPYTPSRRPTSFSIVEPSLGGFGIPNIPGLGRKASFNISPGFTSIIGNIKMKDYLKVSSTFGVTPFQTRGILTGKKAKAGKYFTITDL